MIWLYPKFNIVVVVWYSVCGASGNNQINENNLINENKEENELPNKEEVEKKNEDN